MRGAWEILRQVIMEAGGQIEREHPGEIVVSFGRALLFVQKILEEPCGLALAVPLLFQVDPQSAAPVLSRLNRTSPGRLAFAVTEEGTLVYGAHIPELEIGVERIHSTIQMVTSGYDAMVPILQRQLGGRAAQE